MNTQKTETHINKTNITYSGSAWLRGKEVMCILNCEKSLAHNRIKEINEDGRTYIVNNST